MNVTAEQWAQAEAERQRQAEMVQTLFNEVRRLGTEQSNNLHEIQRLRAEQLYAHTVKWNHRKEPMHHQLLTGRGMHRRENWEAACVFR